MNLRKLKHVTSCKYLYICNALYHAILMFLHTLLYFTTDCLLIMNKFCHKEFLLVPFVCTFIASQLPQILVAVFRHVYLMEAVGVDVFPPPHMNYLIRNSVVNTHNACIILVIVPVLHPPPCSDL
jgi:hypothetical protein